MGSEAGPKCLLMWIDYKAGLKFKSYLTEKKVLAFTASGFSSLPTKIICLPAIAAFVSLKVSAVLLGLRLLCGIL